jgi:hypothetical protein
METQRQVPAKITRKTFLVGAGSLAAGPLLASRALGATEASAGDRHRDGPPVSAYPIITGGTWVRGANLKDAQGRFQARQEHAAVVLNGFVYLIGGFVPIQPPPQPTENDPEPFAFEGTGEVLVYTPQGQLAAPPAVPGQWVSLPQGSWFPLPHMHHIVAVSHRGRIWAFGGHAGPFAPTDGVFIFTPERPGSPVGTWNPVRVTDGRPCRPGEQCLTLPTPRAAGAAVSFGRRIYLMGGVVPYENSPDPVNQSIRTTDSVIYLDTTVFPLRWRRAPSLQASREHFNAVVRPHLGIPGPQRGQHPPARCGVDAAGQRRLAEGAGRARGCERQHLGRGGATRLLLRRGVHRLQHFRHAAGLPGL